jgi:hypothetical protein
MKGVDTARRSDRLRLVAVIALGLLTAMLLYGAVAGTVGFLFFPRGFCIPDHPDDCRDPLDLGPLIFAAMSAVGAVGSGVAAVSVERRRRRDRRTRPPATS